jgi:CheY-like chemotaxis protein
VPAAVLVVAGDDAKGEALVARIAREGLAVRRATTGTAARAALAGYAFGCVVVDLDVTDVDAVSFVTEIASAGAGHSAPPGPNAPAIVVHASRSLDKGELFELEKFSVVVMREGASEERLLDEVRAFVRRIGEGLAPSRFGSSERVAIEEHLAGRRVLVVDDDMRTAYALSATLRAKGMDILLAESGSAALEILEREPDLGAVLMDMMMPEMDGYEATRRIRRHARFTSLPVIALTAKAMKGDRERCLEAGANEYLSKPVDIGKLLSLLGSLMTGGQKHAE